MKTLHPRTKLTSLLATSLAVASFALSPPARAACQQGCDTLHLNTFLGDDALINNTTGFDNTANGVQALENNTTGYNNTANGAAALKSNKTGTNNTAIGSSALIFNTTGINNTANGAGALEINETGNNNTANGVGALALNTTGGGNTANGFDALLNNNADSNTASGYSALSSNTTGANNVANGVNALLSNTTGTNNTANGVGALSSNTTGGGNTANGVQALAVNTTGNNNIALGISAGFNLTTGSNNIDIGALGLPGESNTMRLGRKGVQKTTFMAGISGVTVAGGVGVIVDTNGHLGTVVSSARYKDAIQPMDKASDAILALQPVTFRYKHDLDPDGIPQFGLVAEQVEKVNPDLVARDDQGKPYTVRYEAVNAMLLNEFLKEHRKVQTLEASLAQVEIDSSARAAKQQSEIDSLTAALKTQAAQIQKVSDQLRTQAPAPHVVANN